MAADNLVSNKGNLLVRAQTALLDRCERFIRKIFALFVPWSSQGNFDGNKEREGAGRTLAAFAVVRKAKSEFPQQNLHENLEICGVEKLRRIFRRQKSACKSANLFNLHCGLSAVQRFNGAAAEESYIGMGTDSRPQMGRKGGPVKGE